MKSTLKRLAVVLSFVPLFCAGPVFAESSPPDVLEVLELTGEITSYTADDIEKKVDQINNNKSVKAVVFVVKSPGGGVVPSEKIYEAVSSIKVPVVGWCDGLCASGGEYSLMATSVKYIGVRPGTIAGSIGVISQVTRFAGLLQLLHISSETYKSGSLKDAGNSMREKTDEEVAYLQEIVDTLAGRFYALVGKSRKITDWNAVKSARIFIGKQAVTVGLADAVMSKDAAIEKAKELSGSKRIFTRDELKVMSKIAEGPAAYSAPEPVAQPRAEGSFGDVASLIEIVKEIRAGETTTFAYRLPYRF